MHSRRPAHTTAPRQSRAAPKHHVFLPGSRWVVVPAATVTVAVCGTRSVENTVSATFPGATVVAKRVGKNFAIRAVHANAGIFQRTVGGLVLDPTRNRAGGGALRDNRAGAPEQTREQHAKQTCGG